MDVTEPIGSLDAPDGTVPVAPPVSVAGWAVAPGGPVQAVEIVVDGDVVGRARLGLVRPDVADYYPVPHALLSGFDYVVPPAVLDPDATVMELEARVVTSTGERVSLARRTVPLAPLAAAVPAVVPPTMVGGLEVPDGAEPVSRPVSVSGWAMAPGGPVRAVEIVVDGDVVGRARLGLVRPDVADYYPVPHALLSGFEYVVSPAVLGSDVGEMELGVVVVTGAGERALLLRRTVALAPPPEVDRSAAIRSDRARVQADRSVGRRVASGGEEELRLLVMTHDLGYGGGQLWLSELLDRTGAGRRFPCTVVSPEDGPLAESLEAMGIEVHVSGGHPLRSTVGFEGRQAEMLAWAASGRYTAALVNTFVAFAGADLASRLGLPYVWAIHESYAPDTMWAAAFPPGWVDPMVASLATRALGQAGALVFEAEATRRLYLSSARPGNAVVVPYGVRTAAIVDYCRREGRADVRRRLGIAPSDRVLLMMGTVEPRKAQAVVAQAFDAVRRLHTDAVLVCVGNRPDANSAALHRYVEEAGLGSRARLEPVTGDTYAWYRAADALVCGSDVESLPRSVLEAMCFGVPVLATSVFGLEELITDGENGLLYEPLDLGAAVGALDRLLGMSPDELARVGANGRALVMERYDSVGYTGDVEHLLRGLVRSGGTATAEALLAGRRRSVGG